MAWTQADVDAIDEALRRGVNEVVFADGRSVVYARMDDLLKIRAMAISAIGDAGAVRAKRYSFASIPD